MKKGSKGFTLIELLIVTVVIVMLMGIVFRLAGTGGESSKRAITVARLQRLSNAIGGYYAAFGSYPPVPLQGRSRNIKTKVDANGVQSPTDGDGKDFDPDQIDAACKAQPVALTCPFHKSIKGMLEALAQLNPEFWGNKVVIETYGTFNMTSSDWSENQVLQFGLMSFLLPRYEVMMDGLDEIYKTEGDRANGPWGANNRLPFLLDGTRLESWGIVQGALGVGFGPTVVENGDSDLAVKIRNLPSQAACARWMPNLEGIVSCAGKSTFFGIDVKVPDDNFFGDESHCRFIRDGGYTSSGSKNKHGISDDAIYVQNVYTVVDGWGHDLYYYSPPPYQSYTLWSAGPDGKTFPPWEDKSQYTGGQIDDINKWIKDDVKAGDK